jgi:hypothetical protein
MRILDAERARAVSELCELFVPGSRRVGPEVYVDAALHGAGAEVHTVALQAIDELSPAIAGGADALAEHEGTPAFELVRALACEAFYSDFVAPGAPGPGAWREIDFAPPLAARLAKDWSFLGIEA